MENKPLTVARDEYMRGLVELTNGCGLPYFVVSDVLEKMKAQVDRLAAEQLQRDMALWKQEVTKADEA